MGCVVTVSTYVYVFDFLFITFIYWFFFSCGVDLRVVQKETGNEKLHCSTTSLVLKTPALLPVSCRNCPLDPLSVVSTYHHSGLP